MKTKKRNLTLKQLVDAAQKLGYEVEISFDKKKPPIIPKETKVTIPEEGHQKFYVVCERFGIFTTIGADNQHHASNKATKLFGPNWSQISQQYYFPMNYNFMPYREFKELLKTLPI